MGEGDLCRHFKFCLMYCVVVLKRALREFKRRFSQTRGRKIHFLNQPSPNHIVRFIQAKDLCLAIQGLFLNKILNQLRPHRIWQLLPLRQSLIGREIFAMLNKLNHRGLIHNNRVCHVALWSFKQHLIEREEGQTGYHKMNHRLAQHPCRH